MNVKLIAVVVAAILLLGRRTEAAPAMGGGGNGGGGGGFPIGFEEATPFPDVPMERFPRILPEEQYAGICRVGAGGPCNPPGAPLNGTVTYAPAIAPGGTLPGVGGAVAGVAAYAPIPGTTDPVLNVGGASVHRVTNLSSWGVF